VPSNQSTFSGCARFLQFHDRSAIDSVAIKFKCCHSPRDELYATRFQSLDDVADDFLSGAWAIDAACFCVPRPIRGRRESPDQRCVD
jgi:hypothetical protein